MAKPSITSADFVATSAPQSTVNIMKIFDKLQTETALWTSAEVELLLVQGAKVKRMAMEKRPAKTAVGGSWEVTLFSVDVTFNAGQLSDTSVSLPRLSAVAMLVNESRKMGITPSFFLALPQDMQTELKEVETLVGPGLQFVFKAYLDLAQTPLSNKIFSNTPSMKGAALLLGAALAMDWLSFVRQPGATQIRFSQFCGSTAIDSGPGSVLKSILRNAGISAVETTGLTSSDLEPFRKFVKLDSLPKVKGAGKYSSSSFLKGVQAMKA